MFVIAWIYQLVFGSLWTILTLMGGVIFSVALWIAMVIGIVGGLIWVIRIFRKPKQ